MTTGIDEIPHIGTDEPELSIPSLDDFIPNGQYTDDDGVPTELRPKRKYTSRKKQKEAVATVAETIAMLNGMFGMMVPCSCANTIPMDLRGIAHRDNCTKLYPLTEDETKALSAAIAQEFEAHPDWIDKLEHADVWMAHAMLAASVFGIVMARRSRTGVILLPPGYELTIEQREAMGISDNGVHA